MSVKRPLLSFAGARIKNCANQRNGDYGSTWMRKRYALNRW